MEEDQDGNPGSRGMASLNFNRYATIKSMAEGMLDIALLMSNASQLVTVVTHGSGSAYYTPLIVLISLSLVLQMTIFIFLVFIAKLNVNEVDKQKRLNLLNNVATLMVGAALVVNVFITALGAHKNVKQTATGITTPPPYSGK
eukprot:gi/632954319/ref/XP_007892894.1/ PREDICTED: ninjurin-2-like isoform X2 [Callorhinchus milii]